MTIEGSVASWPSRKVGASVLNQAVDIAFLHISQLASAIEGDPSRVREWYRSVCIRELGDMTAQQLVRQGSADLVIGFLRSILRGERH
ncbi:hypothetical protein [Dyella nitratireducens]|uniref:Antitoxin Xre/MbcA/ParS-like toxin-binding domain-containing protein n=1 Tax=Dyella nitratireducens TaxID=1849580 RepID=A0ABQ1GER5_9GAMM|nr:hypothetical protein [Dyella nitratireducens]GGA42147.1 hypothetical protein GCM10010981_34000 [Dyella nitratireducens]GLQ42044.1 hypothetical protein GCM10007902_18940 [Dyella nitratireducens]